ncbi:uncharacterized protein [Watersipora subatra]|uniref:uncharacterized protein isoform X2 n=1 Tax=Watersipora subatra TaxID=2589382 RepID=UPI00355C4ACA
MDPLLSDNSVKRIQDVTFSPSNLLNSDELSEFWISGEGGQATITLSFDRFYRILYLAMRVETLPKSLTVQLQRDTLLLYTSDCAFTETSCIEWKVVTIYNNLLVIDLGSEVTNKEQLRADKLKIILEGYFSDIRQPYVMKGIEVYADCGCMQNNSRCEVDGADPSSYTCVCNTEYVGEYCERCADGYTDDMIACVPCSCNLQGAANQLCDKNTGSCVCKEGVEQSKAGYKCNPYFTSVSPEDGPLAGGTLVKIEGVLLNQITNISIGDFPCFIDSKLERTNTMMYCLTGEATEDSVNKLTQFILTIDDGSTSEITYSSMERFEYHSNPNITTISRTSAFYSGGLELWFDGTDLQGVYRPLLLLHITCNHDGSIRVPTYEESCPYNPLEEQYRCFTPNFALLENNTKLCIPDRNRRQVSSDLQEFYTIWLGLKLDGYLVFNNLSEPSWLKQGPFDIYPDPVIYDFMEPNQIREFDVKTGSTPTLVLAGENLKLGAEVTDYRIRIGSDSYQSCTTMNLTDAALQCTMKDRLPPAAEGAPRYGDDDQLVPLVQVSVGSLSFQPGYIYYNQEQADNKTTIIVSVVLGVVFCIALGVFVFLYKRKLNRRRREEAREALEGFELVDNTNSLQTQVQSILIEENLNEPLLAHIIPASFLSQESIIGQGHFGQVYKGKIYIPGKNINKAVAIKALKPMGLTPKDVVNFVKEALLMKDFKHMNVLQLIGIVYEPTDPECLPLVVTPLMENGDLKTLISNEFYDFSAGDLLHFGLQVSAGMAYLSNGKFIHRDLRAANCMVDASFIVKIGDFGLSHDVSESDYYRAQDKGKPLPVKWMAIEVLSEKSKYTTQSDVWSFGILLWELMTRGYQPYADVHNSQIKNHIMNGHRLEKPEFIPETVYDIMTACWAIEPDARPTFDELTAIISDMLKQADGSISGYQKNYTSTLASVDYMNPQTLNDSSVDDWSTIIPLIKNFGEDYIDSNISNEVDEGEDSDDSETETERLQTVQVGLPNAKDGSLHQQLQRMHEDPTHLNDYGRLLSKEDSLDVEAGPSTRESGETRTTNSQMVFDNPPTVPRRPSELLIMPPSPRRRLMLDSESTFGVPGSISSFDSLSSYAQTPSRDTTTPDGSVGHAQQQRRLSATAEDPEETSEYEEALPVRIDRQVQRQDTVTSVFGVDGYLEFETIQSAPLSAPLSPENDGLPGKSEASKCENIIKDTALDCINSQASPNLDLNTHPDTYAHGQKMKMSKKERSPSLKQSKVGLLTRVPVNSPANSNKDSSVYEEAVSVWQTRGSAKTAASKADIGILQPMEVGTPNIRSTVTSDGYLEFKALADDEPVSIEPLETSKESPLSISDAKQKRLETLKHQEAVTESDLPSPELVESKVIQESSEEEGASLESMESSKPIARITPMTRVDDYDMFIPIPVRATAAQRNEHAAYVNEALIMDENYINVPITEPKEPARTQHMRSPKPPVPQTRLTVLAKKKNEMTPHEELSNSQANVASPNTRRRKIQESLNEQTSFDG